MTEQVHPRRIALIGPLSGERFTAQTAGYSFDPSKMLPVADVVLLVVDREPGATMLFRYTAHGDFGGDTFHTSTDEALEQAQVEYGDACGVLMCVHDEVSD